MDINYELYKYFISLQKHLSFSVGIEMPLYFSVSRQPVCEGSGKKAGPDALYPKHEAGPAHPGRRDLI